VIAKAKKIQRLIPYAHNVPTFAVPQKVLCNNRLRKLSGDGLALYLMLAWKLHRRREPKECAVTDFEVSLGLGIPVDMVAITRTELRDFSLIEYTRTSQGAKYRFPVDEVSAPADTTTKFVALTRD